MAYNIIEFPSFCGGKIVHNVRSITVQELKQLQKNYNRQNGAVRRHLFAIVVIRQHGHRSVVLLNKFKKYGWKTHGRAFVNPITGNKVQMIKL